MRSTWVAVAVAITISGLDGVTLNSLPAAIGSGLIGTLIAVSVGRGGQDA